MTKDQREKRIKTIESALKDMRELQSSLYTELSELEKEVFWSMTPAERARASLDSCRGRKTYLSDFIELAEAGDVAFKLDVPDMGGLALVPVYVHKTPWSDRKFIGWRFEGNPGGDGLGFMGHWGTYEFTGSYDYE